MGKINVGRWVMGGIAAAVVLFVIDFAVNGLFLGQRWAEAMAALGKPAMGQDAGSIALFALFDLIIGLTAVWIYAGIRPRFGAGVTTAVYAGLATWVLGYALPGLYFLSFGLFPADLAWITIVVGVVEAVAATVAGAYLYQEA